MLKLLMYAWSMACSLCITTNVRTLSTNTVWYQKHRCVNDELRTRTCGFSSQASFRKKMTHVQKTWIHMYEFAIHRLHMCVSFGRESLSFGSFPGFKIHMYEFAFHRLHICAFGYRTVLVLRVLTLVVIQSEHAIDQAYINCLCIRSFTFSWAALSGEVNY